MSATTDGLRAYLDYCDHEWSVHYQVEQRALQTELNAVPPRFGLRGFPGEVFQVVRAASYYSDSYGTQLYTYRQDSPGEWLAFAKGSPSELRRRITYLPGMSDVEIDRILAYSHG